MNKAWFSSDLHLGHKNILKFSPVRIDILGLNIDKKELAAAYEANDKRFIEHAVKQYDERFIQCWNDTIGFSEDVFVLGDVSFRKYDETVSLLNRMHGRLHLVKGNHDYDLHKTGRFEWVKDYYEVNFGEIKAVMFHYPVFDWNRASHGSWMIHGHVHGEDTGIVGKIIDVAPEATKKIAVTVQDVAEYMKDKPVLKHHGKVGNRHGY